jgi:hypothetical protein
MKRVLLIGTVNSGKMLLLRNLGSSTKTTHPKWNISGFKVDSSYGCYFFQDISRLDSDNQHIHGADSLLIVTRQLDCKYVKDRVDKCLQYNPNIPIVYIIIGRPTETVSSNQLYYSNIRRVPLEILRKL